MLLLFMSERRRMPIVLYFSALLLDRRRLLLMPSQFCIHFGLVIIFLKRWQVPYKAYYKSGFW